MQPTDEDQQQADAREKAATLLRDRHQREAEALAGLMAAASRRAAALEAVARETEQVAGRLAEMSRLGFDQDALADLGLDLADLRASRRQEVSAPEVAETRGCDAADGSARGGGDHVGGVRTTAQLTGGLLNHPNGATR